MNKILLDTAKGGYSCTECERIIGPDETQLILSDEEEIEIICFACLESGDVNLW